MTEEQTIAIYIRKSKVYVLPLIGSQGIKIEVEPVITASLDEVELAKVIELGMHNSLGRESISFPSLRSYKSPVLAAANEKSVKQFEKGLSYFTVKRTAEKFEIQKFQKSSNSQGFEPEGSPTILPLSTRMDQIAGKILSTLK